MSQFDLKGKKIIVTGASSGIGRGTAIALANLGADVAICARRKEELQETAGYIKDLGVKCLYYKVDQTIPKDINDFLNYVISQFGYVDGFVANAGVTVMKHFMDTTQEEIDRVVDTNLKGTLSFLSCVSRLMKKQKREGQSIVVVSSINGQRPLKSQAIYSSTKAMLDACVEGLAAELAKQHPPIRVNTVAPGATVTEMGYGKMTREQYEFRLHNEGSEIPLGRFAEPDEMGHAIAFLLSDAASYITGANLLVDGGLKLNRD